MLSTKRKPVSAGEILVEEFLQPLGLTQSELAEQTGLPRKHVNELCRDRRAITADTALILARVFGNSADFWLNTQRRTDLWEALNNPRRAARTIRRAEWLPKSASPVMVTARRRATSALAHTRSKGSGTRGAGMRRP